MDQVSHKWQRNGHEQIDLSSRRAYPQGYLDGVENKKLYICWVGKKEISAQTCSLGKALQEGRNIPSAVYSEGGDGRHSDSLTHMEVPAVSFHVKGIPATEHL